MSADADKTDDTDADDKDPVDAIFDIIDRYYEGLKREEEGMGSE